MLIRILLVLLAVSALGQTPSLAGDRYALDTGRDIALGSAAVVGGFAVWQGASRVRPLTEAELAALDVDALPAFDRLATRYWSPAAARASDVLGYGLALAPLALLLDTGEEMSAAELLTMYLETMALDRVLVGGLKLGVGRVRPLAYNPDPRITDEERSSRYSRRSFPSGHTSGAFAGAMFTGQVYARMHPDDDARHWVRGGALTLATLTGILRVRAGHHFPSDALLGAIIGTVVGWAVPELHETDPDPVAPEGAEPVPMGPSLAWSWAF